MAKKIFTIMISLILISIAVVGLFLYKTGDVSGNVVKQHNPKYHFAAILENQNLGFTSEMERGIIDAARDFNVAVEIKKTGKTNIKQEVAKYFDMSILSMVDGIVLNATEQEELIYKAINAGIPVANIENNSVVGTRIVNIGTNIYETGARIGAFIINEGIKEPKIALIIPESEETRYKNLILSGIWSSIEKNKEAQVVVVRTSKSGVLDAEEVALNIINKYPEVNIILCTTIENTLGAAQVVIDTNRKGEIFIVGYDLSEDIVKHIYDKTILGAVYRNSYLMGYEGIKSLIEMREKKSVYSYNEMNVEMIYMDNVEIYEKLLKENRHGK